MRLYLVTTVEGMPVTWCLAHPKLGEREVMAALLEIDHHLVQSGQVVILADRGFAGGDFELFPDHLGVYPVRPAGSNTTDPMPSQAEFRLLRLRQWIEAIFDTLKGQLSLEQHGSRARHGMYARVGQRLLAMAACIWHNTNIGALSKRSLIAYDHCGQPCAVILVAFAVIQPRVAAASATTISVRRTRSWGQRLPVMTSRRRHL